MEQPHSSSAANGSTHPLNSSTSDVHHASHQQTSTPTTSGEINAGTGQIPATANLQRNGGLNNPATTNDSNVASGPVAPGAIAAAPPSGDPTTQHVNYSYHQQQQGGGNATLSHQDHPQQQQVPARMAPSNPLVASASQAQPLAPAPPRTSAAPVSAYPATTTAPQQQVQSNTQLVHHVHHAQLPASSQAAPASSHSWSVPNPLAAMGTPSATTASNASGTTQSVSTSNTAAAEIRPSNPLSNYPASGGSTAQSTVTTHPQTAPAPQQAQPSTSRSAVPHPLQSQQQQPSDQQQQPAAQQTPTLAQQQAQVRALQQKAAQQRAQQQKALLERQRQANLQHAAQQASRQQQQQQQVQHQQQVQQQQQVHQQQQQGVYPQHTQVTNQVAQQVQQQSANPQYVQSQQQQTQAAHYSQQNPQQPRVAQQQAAPAPGQAPRQGRPKVKLSQLHRDALGRVIASAVKSPDGQVEPHLLEAAMKTGLPRQAILNAAKVARERRLGQRMAAASQTTSNPVQVQGQSQGQVHGQPPAPSAPSAQPVPAGQHQPAPVVPNPQQQSQYAPVQPAHAAAPTPAQYSSGQYYATQQQQVQQQQQQQQYQPPQQQQYQQQHRQPVQPQSAYRAPQPVTQNTPAAAAPMSQAGHQPVQARAVTQTQQHAQNTTQPQQTSSAPIARPAPKPAAPPAAPENPWKRVQNATMIISKSRFSAIQNSVSAYSSSTTESKTLGVLRKPEPPKVSMVTSENLKVAQLLRNKLNQQQHSSEPLYDPKGFRRIKVEPKKYARALDRATRKARQTTADALLKTHKELTKSLLSHQSEFFKFHKNRKADALRIAKTCRDTLDKEEKQREKDAAAAERARLAALKSNDMTAYSKLLEETKNDRLKFLMDKTEESFSQISTLLHERGGGHGNTAAGSNEKKKESSSYYEKAHFQSEEVRQPSILVGGDLKEYQLAGLQWLVSLYNNKLNGILADEMGLGKTIQAISLVGYLMEFKNNLGPYLVIVPLSTLSNWQNEFQKWCPSARLVCYKGTPAVRKDIYKEQVSKGHFNVLLTTYEYIIKDKKFLRKIDWTYAIVDEGHRMKNAQSKFAVTLGTHYNTEYRVLLTGTPLMNQLSELWSLLNFLLPSVFNSVESFDQWFSRPFQQFGSSSAANGERESEADQLLSNEERMLIIHRLHELLRPFMLRRVKAEVLDQLPEKVEKVLRCELSSWQKELYKQISIKAVESNKLLDDSYVQPQPAVSRGLNNVVMQLRKVCNHPMLFSPEGYQINDTVIRSSGKVALLDQMLPKLKSAGHRVLIFTQMTAVMTILEDYFSLRGYLSLRLDGSTPADVREKRMYKFNAPDSPYFIFLLSTRAGGLGLNLTAADTVIIFDSDWNPMMDLQAQDRAHRIGQRSDVSVFRMVTNSPVEEKILSRATEKLNTAALVVEAGKFNKGSVESDNSLERKQMMEILLTDFDSSNVQASAKGLSEKSGSDNGDDDDNGSEASEKEDLNELLSNNETDYQLYAQYDERRSRVGPPLAELYTSPEDVPNWIKYPGGKKQQEEIENGPLELGDGSRKRKAVQGVVYDDGLTEKQFLRLMDKQVIEEEKQLKAKKRARKGAKAGAKKAADEEAVNDNEEEEEEEETGAGGGSLLTDWTFRKLISCTKNVITLKEPGTKRRLADLFLEKPAPQQFPDYYELIEKPIAINDILRKCRGKIYNTFVEYRDDWKLMIANAVKFNGEDSWVVQDALALEKELDRVLKRNGFSADSLPSPGKKKSPKKKLRIKLSLKTVKDSSENGEDAEGEDGNDHAPAPEAAPPKKKRGRKRKKT